MNATSMGLPEVVAAIMVLALNAYALTGGADFGGGVWDLLARGPGREAQRALIAEQIAPIWEANHVWLILVVVMLFTAFPAAFAALGIVLHIPLTLMLLGIVARGSSFVFRSYGARDDASQRRWGRVFAIASVVTPLLLGMIVGAIVSGAAGIAAASVSSAPGASRPSYVSLYVTPWLAPFPFAIGVLALAMFAFLAAVYLAVREPALRDAFRRRAFWSAGAMFIAAFGALGVAGMTTPHVMGGLMRGGALVLQLVIALAALAAIWAVYERRWRFARIAAAAQVSLILWGWVLVQAPYVLPPTMTIRNAAAPRVTLELLLGALAAGAVLLLPALWYLFRTFAAERRLH
ncbi:MAG: cytochrome d ubiquinol oxidase subunit II [Gemmatimonadaceae bacterium]